MNSTDRGRSIISASLAKCSYFPICCAFIFLTLSMKRMMSSEHICQIPFHQLDSAMSNEDLFQVVNEEARFFRINTRGRKCNLHNWIESEIE